MTDIEQGKLSDFKPQVKNANAHTERGLKLLGNAYSEVGYVAPMTATADGEIIDGSARLEVAFDQFPDDALIVRHDGQRPVIMVREDIVSADTPEAKKISYSANRVGELDLSWNPETILADLDTVDLSGLFREDELSEILGELGKDEEQAPVEPAIDRAEELQQEYGTESGQLWTMGEHRLLIGDCRNPDDVARLVDGKQVNGVFTSPPYAEQRKKQYGGVPTGEYVEWWEAVQNNMRGVLAEDGSFFVNIKPHCEDGQRVLYVADLVLAMVRRWGWRFVDELCWKHQGYPGDYKGRFRNEFEPIHHFTKRDKCKHSHEPVMVKLGEGHQEKLQRKAKGDALFQPGYSHPNSKSNMGNFQYYGDLQGRQHGNVLQISIGANSVQAAAFPLLLPTFFIKAYSDPGDIWLDPFAGSGTTIMACHNEDRIGYGMEILPKYGAVILHRWEQATNQKAKLLNA